MQVLHTNTVATEGVSSNKSTALSALQCPSKRTVEVSQMQEDGMASR